MTYVFLTISVLINIGLIWYVRVLLQKFVFISENVDDMFYSLDNYSKHLESLYKLETYYGDETLESLIKHSKNVVLDMEDFKNIYSLEEEQDKAEQDGEEEE
tara:strand:+ start:518 stop:823 length:306 start_codon:yes stop_codon:yes gene_type:complete